MRKRVGAAIIAVLSVGGLLLGTGPAQAASQDIPTFYVGDGYIGGSAEFISLGDKLVVCDQKNGDGYGAYAELSNANTGEVLEWVYDGVPDGVCQSTAKDLYEETPVHIDLCLRRNNDSVICIWSATGRV
ncbi:hypothetical protein [Streptomyces sp. NPDC020983]|uniref:hypothetical protein n=1 Tax=Streptomyces sp. NPDC020983 TaxID=3365106 RepID=UPI0037A08809